MNLVAVELDPNQTIAAFVTVVVALVGMYGVMLQQGKRLKVVKEQVSGANGTTLGEDVYATKEQLDRLTRDSRERWDVTLATSEMVAKVHNNQVNALLAAQDLMKEIAAIKQQQHSTDQRLGQLENHSTRELSELRAIVSLLSSRVDALVPSPNNLTPPRGIPTTVAGQAPYPGPLDPHSV